MKSLCSALTSGVFSRAAAAAAWRCVQGIALGALFKPLNSHRGLQGFLLSRHLSLVCGLCHVHGLCAEFAISCVWVNKASGAGSSSCPLSAVVWRGGGLCVATQPATSAWLRGR